jgi:hypothetical protein
VLFDLSGALGGVSTGGDGLFAAGGGADGQPPVVASWHGAAHVVRREAVPKSDFVRALEAEAEADPDTRAHDARSDDEHEGDGDDDDAEEPRGRARRPAPAAAPAPQKAPGEQNGEEEEEEEGVVERAGAALEGHVSYWSDFSKVLLHPRSALLLPGVWHGVAPFEGFGDSRDFASGEAAEEAHDRIRCEHTRIPRALAHPPHTHTHTHTHRMLRRVPPAPTPTHRMQLLRGGVRRCGGLPRACAGRGRLRSAD